MKFFNFALSENNQILILYLFIITFSIRFMKHLKLSIILI